MGFNVYVVQSKFSYCVCHYCSLKLIKICLLNFLMYLFPAVYVADRFVRVSCTLSFPCCQIVILTSRALLYLLSVRWLCQYLAHFQFSLVPYVYIYLVHFQFSQLFDFYVGISSTLGFSWCFIVTSVSRARLVFFGVPLEQ